MDERPLILPPPPPARIAVWARVNALWFRLVGGLLRGVHGVVRRARRLTEASEPVTSPQVFGPEGRISSLLARFARAERGRLSATLRDPERAEQPTLVDVRKGESR